MKHNTAYSKPQVAALLAAATHPLGQVPQPVEGLIEQGLTFGYTMVEGEGTRALEWLTEHGWQEAQRLGREAGLQVPQMPYDAGRLAQDLAESEQRMKERYLADYLVTLAFCLLCVDNGIKYPTSKREPWYKLESRLERSVRSYLLNESLKQVNGGTDILATGGYTDAARELIAQVVIYLSNETQAHSLAQDADMPEAMKRRVDHRSRSQD
ncbi:hypothetical protein [Nocardiopsis synnemataformans]|uniref:hypothetical protein n=1 Tax=Nocardiopsis synnemataformans TaxID=61305 RepID=UPI003EB8C62C